MIGDAPGFRVTCAAPVRFCLARCVPLGQSGGDQHDDRGFGAPASFIRGPRAHSRHAPLFVVHGLQRERRPTAPHVELRLRSAEGHGPRQALELRVVRSSSRDTGACPSSSRIGGERARSERDDADRAIRGSEYRPLTDSDGGIIRRTDESGLSEPPDTDVRFCELCGHEMHLHDRFGCAAWEREEGSSVPVKCHCSETRRRLRP